MSVLTPWRRARGRARVAVIGSGFAGSLMARVLARIGHDVVLVERGTHPRFAIGESTTPLANLSLERLARRYGMADCYRLAAHGRWLEHYPHLRRGLKRGFTFYRHHPGEPFANRGLDSERLLVAASPEDAVADTHWLRADIDRHFVDAAVADGVEYRDRTELSAAHFESDRVRLAGAREGIAFTIDVDFVIDASGPGGFLARQLAIPSALARTETRSALVFSHFAGMRTPREVAPGLPDGPYPDEWAAVHHLIDEGWMYALRFDDGVTSAGFTLTPPGLAALRFQDHVDADALWRTLLERYPTIGAAFDGSTPLMPLRFQALIQHRLTRSAGERWAMLPHAYAFVDPLFSTGIAWGLRAVERLVSLFESASSGVPDASALARYDVLLSAEADQIDRVVAGAYDAMAHFELFAAHAMLYFATVSFAEVRQRLLDEEGAAWGGFLGVGDAVLEPLPAESLVRLRKIVGGQWGRLTGTADDRRRYAEWVAGAVAPRNVAGLADPARHHLYPVDLDVLIDRHTLLGLTRERMLASLPALRGMSPEPSFASG